MARIINDLSHASWLYPFKGIYYFLVHPFLYPLFRSRIIPAFLLSTFVTVNFFFWTYLPQVAALFIYQKSSAWLNATVLVLGESAAATAILFEIFFVDESQVDIFDAVLIQEGCADIVANGRELVDAPTEEQEAGRQAHRASGNENGRSDPKHTANPAKRLGRIIKPAEYSPFSVRQIVEFILFLPLNFVPYVGTPLFLVATGYRAGPLHHWRYFRLRQFDKKARKQYIERRKLTYTWFGTSALVLQLVPILSMLFLCTSAVGSALWAARLEKQRRAISIEADSDSAREGPYADDPV